MAPEQIAKLFLLGTFPNGVLGGLAINVILAVVAMAIGFVLGLVLALGRVSRFLPLRALASVVVEGIRAIPLILILFWIHFLLPLATGGPVPVLLSAFVAISLYSAVNQAEIFRSGILNIDKEQWQAAASTGLSRIQCVRFVILPQAVHRMFPSFVSFFISMFKDTSIATVVGVIDVTRAGLLMSQNYPSQFFAAYGLMAGLFFVICFALSRLGKRLEDRQHARYGIPSVSS